MKFEKLEYVYINEKLKEVKNINSKNVVIKIKEKYFTLKDNDIDLILLITENENLTQKELSIKLKQVVLVHNNVLGYLDMIYEKISKPKLISTIQNTIKV